MKKYIVWALAALLMVPVSCNKGNQDNPMDEPATKDLAQVITFKTAAMVGVRNIQSIEFTEASRYIVTYTVTKAESENHVIFGNYTYTNGTFNLDGFGHVTIKGSEVTITTATTGGSPVTATATITPTTTSDTPHDNLCRNWKVGKIIIGLSGGSFGAAGIEKVFNNGIKMDQICTWLDDNNISISEENRETLLKYSVEEVCVTGAGSIAISFNVADAFLGHYQLNNSNISFGFDSSDIPFITSGQFSGTVSFEGTNCLVIAQASMVHNEKTYKATFEMTLTEAK
jgi:hypothetical protein